MCRAKSMRSGTKIFDCLIVHLTDTWFHPPLFKGRGKLCIYLRGTKLIRAKTRGEATRGEATSVLTWF